MGQRVLNPMKGEKKKGKDYDPAKMSFHPRKIKIKIRCYFQVRKLVRYERNTVNIYCWLASREIKHTLR